ncbi:MAG: hypothetical protein ACP5P9_02975 [Acidimicrobiales bacterium]
MAGTVPKGTRRHRGATRRAAVLIHGRIVREGPPSQVADVALGDYLSG